MSGGLPPPPPTPPNTVPVDWQERCVHLEEALHRFRDQTARIRNLLREKLAELDQRLCEAEKRADKSEDKARTLEERLTLEDKDRLITELQSQVQEQKEFRAEEARQIETKAVKIKEWVTAKLRDLEEENHQLREENVKYKEQLDLLKKRICLSSKEETHHLPDITRVRHVADTQSLDRQASTRKKLDLPRRWSMARASDEFHDYAEIYTPSQETEPPTPPLHRFPSWESRIYEVAVSGISASCDSLKSNHQNLEKTEIKATELNIPVYATVKGRASQIRCVPFTGESTDSSDNEPTLADHEGSPGRSNLNICSPAKSRNRLLSGRGNLYLFSDFSLANFFKKENSVDSELSDDYAVPPDAYPTDSLDGQSFRDGQSTMDRKEDLEISGYLTKLGGKFKTWRRRWFVLRDGNLRYYKSQHDVFRKPQGQIVLDENCRICRADGSATFEICTNKRTYYLTAESTVTMEHWIKVLQNVLRRKATWLLLSREDTQPSISGWLTKVKHGHSRKCWCVLFGRIFLYFKSPNDTIPLGQINMRDVRVQEVVHLSDSDQEDEVSISEFTLAIYPIRQGPTYLLFTTMQEMEAWLYHLTVVSSGDTLTGTQYEQLVSRLMEVEGDQSSMIWRHPALLHTKDNIANPLTTLHSDILQAEAIKLFKSIQLFISVPLDTSGIDYHVALTQNAFQQCLLHPDLQNELFCQLIKQTSRHPSPKLGVQHLLLCATQSLFLCDSSNPEKASPTTSHPPEIAESKLNPPPFVFLQGWQLLALACSLFSPKNRTLWLLKMHLQKNADPRLEAGKYAMFCQRSLARIATNGPRGAKPSRMEVLSILLKNPYHHSLPHSIPVHFLNATYQVVGFDGSTTVKEFVTRLNADIGIRDATQSGFTMYQDDPIDKHIEHCLPHSEKICDILSKWEQALRENQRGKFESSRVIKLTYKNRLCFRHSSKNETDKERLLMIYQINEDMVDGRFPLTRELALEMTVLMVQIEYGDYNQEKPRGSTLNPDKCLQEAVDKFFPKRYKDCHPGFLLNSIRDKWQALKGKTLQDCVRIYLNCARKWSFCCAKLFSAKVSVRGKDRFGSSGDNNVWIAVSDDSVALLDFATMQPIVKYPYCSLMTFGGCKDDFMLVVTSSSEDHPAEKLLFEMPKHKVLEITLLIADYMNALGRPQPSSLGRLDRGRINENRRRAASVDLLSSR